MHKKKVLIINYNLPPSASVGAKRFAILSRFFSEAGMEIFGLSAIKKHYHKIDSSVSFKGKIYRTFNFFPFPKPYKGYILKALNKLWVKYAIYDYNIGWLYPAYFKGKQIVKKNDVDIIIATGPPFISMIVGYKLAKKFNIPLITDFRDPWNSHQNDSRFPKNRGKKYNIKMEKLCLSFASKAVFVTEKMKEEAKKYWGNVILKNKSAVITNGFFDYNLKNHADNLMDTDSFNLVYAGNFYGERNVSDLLDAVNYFAIENELPNIKVHIFGKLTKEDRTKIKKSGIENYFVEHKKIPYTKIHQILFQADVLYLPSGTDVSYAIPFKFFDYLAVKKPILAVTGKETQIYTLFKKFNNIGEVAFLNDSRSVKNALLKIYYKRDEYFLNNNYEIFKWSNIATQYVEVINRIKRFTS